jgi:hypothetical protein
MCETSWVHRSQSLAHNDPVQPPGPPEEALNSGKPGGRPRSAATARSAYDGYSPQTIRNIDFSPFFMRLVWRSLDLKSLLEPSIPIFGSGSPCRKHEIGQPRDSFVFFAVAPQD